MAEKRVIELEVQDNTKTLKQQYKEAVQEVQKLAAAYGETSKEASAAAKRAAELKDSIEDTNDAIAAFKGEGKFVAAGKALSSVANGFSAVEGAMGIVGVESEKLQETMLKVQSAMALAQGLEGLEDAGRAFKQLGAVAMEALKGIKSGIAATGIGLLLVALGTIVAYWDDIKAAVSGVTSEQEALNKKSEQNAAISKEIYDSLQLQENSLKLQGKTEKQILELRVQKINAAIKDEEIRIQGLEATSKMEIAAQERNMKWLKLYVRAVLEGMAFAFRALALPIDKVIETANFVSKALGNGELVATNLNEYISKAVDKASEWTTKLLFDPEETKAETQKTINEAKKGLKQMESDRDGFLLAIKENNKKEIDSNKANSDDIIANKKAELDALIELEIRKANTDEKILTDLLNKRLELEKLKGAQLEVAQQDNAEKIRKAIEEDNSQIIQLETKKITDLKVLSDSRLETLQGGLDAEYEAEKAAAEKRQLILDVQAIRARQAEEKAQSFKVNAVKQGLETIASITELFGKKSEKAARKAFAVQKAAQIATALITTYQNATSAYASQFLPIPDPSSPVRGGIAAGLAVAAGLTNVAKIATQKFEGGGSMGGGSTPSGGGGGGQMTTPNFSVIGSSGVNQLAQIQQKPTRAYVVSGDVANGLSLERNRLQNATL